MKLRRIKIGPIETENNVFLAPLAGYTNYPFRRLCERYGAGLTFTEMVSAKGLNTAAKTRGSFYTRRRSKRRVRRSCSGGNPTSCARRAKAKPSPPFPSSI